jgi:probable HAF family extracellular repeat protein
MVAATAAPVYTIVNLGGVGGELSEAFAVNAGGAVAGRALDVTGSSLGFAYEGFTQVFHGESEMRGINAGGEIVGTRDGYATIWRGGSAESLGTLGGNESYGLGISDSGHSTGAASLRDDRELHAFLSFNGQMLDLGTLGGTWSSGYGVNTAGQVAGVSQTTSGGFAGFRWDASTGMRRLYAPSGASDTRAFAINGQGAVAGMARTSQGYYHAAVWDTNGSVLDLGDFGGRHSFAYGINDEGSVVGYSFDALGRQRAFVWTGGMLFDLNTLLDGEGWSLTAAYGINSNGQIVGTGYYKGVSSAFRLDPTSFAVPHGLSSDGLEPGFGSEVPEPATAVSLLLAGLAGVLYRPKR